MKKSIIIGLPIYTETDWQVQCSNSVDDSKFKNYQEWLNYKQKAKEEFEVNGFIVVDVPINPLEMQDYFEKRGLENNIQNISNYITEKMSKNSRNLKQIWNSKRNDE